MGTLGRAIYTVGFWIRETGQAVDRLGSRLQGSYYFKEQRKRRRFSDSKTLDPSFFDQSVKFVLVMFVLFKFVADLETVGVDQDKVCGFARLGDCLGLGFGCVTWTVIGWLVRDGV